MPPVLLNPAGHVVRQDFSSGKKMGFVYLCVKLWLRMPRDATGLSADPWRPCPGVASFDLDVPGGSLQKSGYPRWRLCDDVRGYVLSTVQSDEEPAAGRAALVRSMKRPGHRVRGGFGSPNGGESSMSTVWLGHWRQWADTRELFPDKSALLIMIKQALYGGSTVLIMGTDGYGRSE